MKESSKARLKALVAVGVIAGQLMFAAASFADTFVHGGPTPGWRLDGNKGVITDVYRK